MNFFTHAHMLHKKQPHKSKGMTLIELMVVLAIFVLVTGLTIFDYSQFRTSVSLQNLADDISLAIRRAQNYAIGVRNTNQQFYGTYGIHFATSPTTNFPLLGSSKSFALFADSNKDGVYTPGTATSCTFDPNVGTLNECIDLLTITSSDQIIAICPDNNGITCEAAGYTNTNKVSIFFTRPNPEAAIYVNGSTTPSGAVTIKIQNTQSQSTKFITVTSTGQMSVK